MNYAGKFDATIPSDGQGSASHFNVHLDSVHGHAPADAIIVPDAHFLFNADFKRSGLDLVLSRDDHELVLHDYFKGEKRAGLASPDGAHLTGDIVNALTGAVEVSQAGAAATGGDVIGHVTKLVGSATVIRNGVSIILNMGDNVEKGDVVQCGSDSTLGLTFIDGTVFGLSANARMVLNEMVYDPNGSNNSSLLSLVAGTITFVAGETAKHGDMKVDTPVATMGIRGTAVLVEIDFTVPGQNATPDAHFQVLVEPDGHTGSYILFDKTTLQPIAEVNQAGQQINITNGVVTQTNAPLSPDIQKLIQDVFTLKFSANDTNPKTTTAQTNTLNPELFVGPTIKLASGATATPVFEILGSNPAADPPKTSGPGNFINHIPGPPTVAVLDPHAQPTTNFALTELIGKTGDGADSDSISGRVNFVDVNAGDLPTVKIDFNSFTYQNAQHQDVTASLNALQLADVAATELKITVVPDSGNQNTGGANFSYGIADSAFDFLAAGERLTLTYNVRVDNNYAPNDESTVVPITITVTGTNDAPVITTDAQKIAFSGGTSQPGGVLTSTDPTKGMLTFTDVDLTDTHTVNAKLTDAVLSNGSTVPPGPLALFEKALTASIELDSTNTGTGTVDWQLAALPVYVADFIPKGQTLTLTYTVTVTDSQGATSDQAVTVTLTGSDNPAVVWIDTASGGTPGGSWSDAANWETGTVPTANDDVIVITDQLIGLKPSYPVTIDGKTSAVAKSLTMDDYSDFAGSQPVLDVLAGGSLTIAGALSLSADSLVHDDGTIIARSLTMTNGTDAASDTPQSPELDVLSTGTLDIGSDGLTLDGNAVLNNQGTVTVAGAADCVDASVLMNEGMLTLRQGGEFAGSSSITNGPSGTIDVAGGTMTASVDIANHGRIIVDGGAVLDLDSRTIDGGTVSIRGASEESGSPGTLELYGGVLQNGMLNNSGLIAVIGSDSALHDETVVNNG
ncbi:MAG: VCBS domain-containing protein, partial [Gemmatimonas sp.]